MFRRTLEQPRQSFPVSPSLGEPARVLDPLLPDVDPAVLMEPEQDIILVSDDEVPPAVIAARRKQNRWKRRMAAASDAIRNIRHQQNIIEISSANDEAPVFHILSNIPRRNEIRCNAQAKYIT